jgi:hypothetical protein
LTESTNGGMTQHNLYHAGQIVLLKRALAATAADR